MGVLFSDSDGKINAVGSTYINVPIGAVIAFLGTVAPEGWLICDGSAFDIDEYPDLYTFLGNSILPDLKDKTIMGGGTLGAVSEGSLPNIIGELSSGPNASVIKAVNGVFEDINNTWGYGNFGPVGSGWPHKVRFNAAKSSPLYKDNQTYVEPANVRMNYIIRAKA